MELEPNTITISITIDNANQATYTVNNFPLKKQHIEELAIHLANLAEQLGQQPGVSIH